MDTAHLDTLRYRLQNYTSIVRETLAHFQGRGGAGTGPAYAPYYERARVLSLFDALAEEGSGIPPDLWQEYSKISRRFERFERAAGPDYRQELVNELASFTQVYQAALCFAYCGEQRENLNGQRPAEREVIGILLNELKKDHDLSDIERLITSLDKTVATIALARNEPDPAIEPALVCNSCDTAPQCNRGIP